MKTLFLVAALIISFSSQPTHAEDNQAQQQYSLDGGKKKTPKAPKPPAPKPPKKAPVCKKGKPCGGACIPLDKVCRK